MASLYSDMKAAMEVLNPEEDFVKFCQKRGAHTMLKLPVQEDIIEHVKKAAESITTASSAQSQSGSSRLSMRRSTTLTLNTTVGKSSPITCEGQKPPIDFTIEKPKDTILQRNSRAIEENEKLAKESQVNPDKSLGNC